MHDGDAYGCLINASRAGARSGGCSIRCCGVGLGFTVSLEIHNGPLGSVD